MKIAQSIIVSATLGIAALISPATFAQTAASATAAKPDAARDLTDGEIRKVDKEAGKLTIKHGDIKNLNMPPMTMAFQVKDKAALDKLKAGDRIKFRAIDENGKLVVTEIQPDK